MVDAEIVLYWLGTEVDRLKIKIRSMAELDLKIQAYKKWRHVEGDEHYKIIVETLEK